MTSFRHAPQIWADFRELAAGVLHATAIRISDHVASPVAADIAPILTWSQPQAGARPAATRPPQLRLRRRRVP
jgi:hypothetical protein